MVKTRPIVRDLDTDLRRDPEFARHLAEAVDEEIGVSLREARRRSRKTQQEVAKVMGVSRSRVSQIEAAQGVSLSLDVLARYAHAIGSRLDISFRDPASDELWAKVYLMESLYAHPAYADAHGADDVRDAVAVTNQAGD